MVHPWHRLTCNHITAISASILTGHPSGAMLFFSLSVMSNSSATPKDCSPTWFLCPWDFPGKNTEISCHFLLHGVFPNQGSNQHLHCRRFFTSEPWEAQVNVITPTLRLENRYSTRPTWGRKAMMMLKLELKAPTRDQFMWSQTYPT